MYNKLPSLARLNELFIYEPITGVLLRKQRMGKLKPCLSYLIRYKDNGMVERLHLRASVDGTVFYTHRIAYYMYHKVDPGELQIDHKDGCGLNNSITNLRLATASQNQANAQSRNFVERNGRYTVAVMLGQKCISGGSFGSEKEAEKAAKELKVELFGEYALV